LDEKTVTVPAINIGAEDFPTDPVRTGYTFVEWNTQANGSGSPFDAATTVNADRDVYAQWDPETYTVTFMRNDGTNDTWGIKTVTVPVTSIGAGNFPMDPTRSDYNFTGWSTQTDDTGTAFVHDTVISGDITVYARWAHSDFIITLGADAGAGAFSQTTFTLSKSVNASQTVYVNGSDYSNPRWEVDGEPRGTANSITLNAADYGLGKHWLTLIISKGGASWSKEISFTINN
jgi:uncharacterized repeat protein (TIGR02543 family)